MMQIAQANKIKVFIILIVIAWCCSFFSGRKPTDRTSIVSRINNRLGDDLGAKVSVKAVGEIRGDMGALGPAWVGRQYV